MRVVLFVSFNLGEPSPTQLDAITKRVWFASLRWWCRCSVPGVAYVAQVGQCTRILYDAETIACQQTFGVSWTQLPPVMRST
jgi:hypothetical protein